MVIFLHSAVIFLQSAQYLIYVVNSFSSLRHLDESKLVDHSNIVFQIGEQTNSNIYVSSVFASESGNVSFAQAE